MKYFYGFSVPSAAVLVATVALADRPLLLPGVQAPPHPQASARTVVPAPSARIEHSARYRGYDRPAGHAPYHHGGPASGPVLGSDGYVIGDNYSPVSLYHRVRYDDRDNIAPGAVERIVAVPNPCPCDCCPSSYGACYQDCVYVRICTPNCPCPRVSVSRKGEIKYDYGEYEVEIRSDDGVVEVDYDD